MNFLGLDNKEHYLDIRQSQYPMRSEAGCKSKLQYNCGKLLKQKYPQLPILEEVYIPDHNFYFDFFLPTRNLVIEIDGSQHEDYNHFFFQSRADFLAQKKRDQNKKVLCDMNGWELIRVKSPDELASILGLPHESI